MCVPLTLSEGMVIEDAIVFSSSSWLLLESCLFKELTLPQPYANQVFEHAGMWRPIVRPIMWAHKRGLCKWMLRCVKIELGQAHAISRAQWISEWDCMYCMCSDRDIYVHVVYLTKSVWLKGICPVEMVSVFHFQRVQHYTVKEKFI